MRQGLAAFMPYGPGAASARVRVLQWLERTGVRAERHSYAGLGNNRPGQIVAHLPQVATAELRSRRLAREDWDRVLIHREVTPFSSGGIVESIAARSRLAVYDFDDALMWSPATRRDRIWSKSESCLRAVGAVDRVIAGSEVLAEWAQGHNRDVRLIPTCVDPDQYDIKIDYAANEIPRLVWLGSASTEPYLQLIADPLLEVHRLTSARLTVISAGSAPLGPVGAMVDRLAWYPGVERQLSSYDIGIAPLADGPWERGKCAYKILQYAAAGLPSVVSPVGANQVAASRLAFTTAVDAASWVEGLMDVLRADPAERSASGRAGRAAVLRHYSFERWTPDWLAAVGEVS